MNGSLFILIFCNRTWFQVKASIYSLATKCILYIEHGQCYCLQNVSSSISNSNSVTVTQCVRMSLWMSSYMSSHLLLQNMSFRWKHRSTHSWYASGMDKGPIPSPQVMLSLSKLIIIQFHTLMLTHPVSNDIVCAVRKALRQSVFYILNMANVIVFKTYLHPIPIL